MRRLLNQALMPQPEPKEASRDRVIARAVPRLGTIKPWDHRPSTVSADLVILHQGVRYEERGPRVNQTIEATPTNYCRSNCFNILPEVACQTRFLQALAQSQALCSDCVRPVS